MATKMDVDPPSEDKADDGRIVAVHPLAIVHMSDQYTRITCGGSTLPRTASVVGLLFGTTKEESIKKTTTSAATTTTSTTNSSTTSTKKSNSTTSSIQILDADDIPTDLSEASNLQVELHRAVFPQHSVVGWYRVSLQDDEPTQDDVLITQRLQQHFQKQEENINFDFVFCLLQVQPKQTPDSFQSKSTLSDELPIQLYHLHSVNNTILLLGISNWHLETSESERIAVERVMREQPQQQQQPTVQEQATQQETSSKTSKKSSSQKQHQQQQQSPYVHHVESIQHSLDSMKERIEILLEFLEDTQNGVIPPNRHLLRQVQGLVYTLGPLAAVTGRTTSLSPTATTATTTTTMSPMGESMQDALMLSHLAAISKTMSSVQAYADKFRLVHENRAVGKEMRRAF